MESAASDNNSAGGITIRPSLRNCHGADTLALAP